MSWIQILTYLCGAIFIVGFAARMLKYATMPMHVRWEIYPIPHEGKAKSYGGSFYEEVDHWKNARHKDHLAMYLFMLPEILFIRALYEDNKSLWYWSFPLHFGLYLCIGGLVFLTLGALLQILGLPPTTAIGSFFQSLTVILGVLGYVLGTVGSLGLLIKRKTDPELSEFSAPIDYMNLAWLGGIFVTGILVWFQDPSFSVSRQFLVSIITFSPMQGDLTFIHYINLLLFLGFFAYFPFTHMTHMVSKYFMWDKVKFDDEPNVGDPAVDAKIKTYLGYPVTWSAAHVDAQGGKRTWAEIATTNPWAKKEEK